MDIALHRLSNQHLIGEKFARPQDAVAWLGAVQAQDYPAAKWALGIRVHDGTESVIENALTDGTILRTHVLRPTWHFVSPQNIRWMLDLTSPRVKTFMGHYNRKLELDDTIFTKSQDVIEKALQGHVYLTRQELKAKLTDIGIKTDVQRLAHIVMWAELDGFICNGPKKGKQFTYALLEERVPKQKKLTEQKRLPSLHSSILQAMDQHS